MITAALILLAAVAGQAQEKPIAFEVAEVKLNTSGAQESRVTLSNGRFLATNVPLRPLIAEAWTITPGEVIGASWLDDVRVDIAAKSASAQTSDTQVRAMVRTLLADRMKLVGHTENREQNVFSLTVWKGKPKLTPSEAARTAEEEDCSLERRDGGIHASCNTRRWRGLPMNCRNSPGVTSIVAWCIRPESRARGASPCSGRRWLN